MLKAFAYFVIFRYLFAVLVNTICDWHNYPRLINGKTEVPRSSDNS